MRLASAFRVGVSFSVGGHTGAQIGEIASGRRVGLRWGAFLSCLVESIGTAMAFGFHNLSGQTFLVSFPLMFFIVRGYISALENGVGL